MSEENNNSNNDLSRDEIDEQLEALCQDQQDDKNECETMTMCYQVDLLDFDEPHSLLWHFFRFLLGIIEGIVIFIMDLVIACCFFIIHPIRVSIAFFLICTNPLKIYYYSKLSARLGFLLGFMSSLGGLVLLIYWLIKKFLF